MIDKPIPAVKPDVIGYGKYRTIFPNFNTPKSAIITLAINNAHESPSIPCSCIILNTITVNAPVGPTIWNLAPPSSEANPPAITHVINPIYGCTPDAIANVINKGNATTETRNPAFTSLSKSFLLYPLDSVKKSSGIHSFMLAEIFFILLLKNLL